MSTRGASLFFQTVVLLSMALIVAQLMAAGMVLSTPPPRPEFTPLTELVAQLREQPKSLPDGLSITRSASIPAAPAGLIEDPLFDKMLAQRLGTSTERVRLWFQPAQKRPPLLGLLSGEHDDQRQYHGVPIRHQEPIFLGTVQAAWFDGRAWVTTSTAPSSMAFTPWQQRIMALFLLQILFLIPLAWVFARRITRPIRGFADAASRLGRGEKVANVPDEGPLELRIAGRALNHMQAQIDGYLRERTAMIGAIAHDLRTPLARIAFRMESAPDQLREKVQADIDGMQQMIGETIAFVRGSSGPYRQDRINLCETARKVVHAFGEAGRPITLDLPEGRAVILGDALALERMLTNLASNAVAFGSEVVIDLQPSGNSFVLTVSDNGPGIPDKQIGRMFEAFERGEPSRNRTTGGVGLGLSIARSIAHAHNAEITLQNRSSGGLVACVKFPSYDAELSPAV